MSPEHIESKVSASPAAEQPTRDASSLSVDIERLVRNEVELQLAKEQKLLKDSVGLAAKIVGAAITLFLAIFTIFGLTTWREIKQETAQIVKKQAEELIQKADSETSVKDTLNDLLNRTVVSSVLAARARNLDDVTLATNDWNRLRAWIKKEDLSLQDFADTLAVLNLQSDERKKTDANRLLAEMLNPPEKSPYKWITKQPEKTSSILTTFKHRDLGLSAVELVASSALTDSIRAEAAVYVREVNFSDGVERLLTTYKTLTHGEARRKALTTCVALRPDQSEVVLEVKRLLSGEPQREKIEIIVDIIALIPRLKSMVDSSVNLDEFRALSRELILYATKNGLYFDINYPNSPGINPFTNQDDWSSRQAVPPPLISLMLATSKSSASGVGTLSISEFRELEAYWGLLAEFANAGDIGRFRSLLVRESFVYRGNSAGIQYQRVVMSAEAGAKVTIIDNRIKKDLELKDLKDVNVVATNSISDPTARIYWYDQTGEVVTAQLEGFKGAHYAFKLQKVNISK
jgi:hypothetical protein